MGRRILRRRGAGPGRRALLLVGVLTACSASADPTNTPATGTADEPICPAPGPGVEVGGDDPTSEARPTSETRLVLMGGGPEVDPAMLGFLEAAAGGDVLVLRATGSLTSYPDYFRRTLAPDPSPASASTVRTSTPSAGDDPAVLCRLAGAEAIWLAGGNQWDYLGGWPPALHAALSEAGARGAVVGGTSAGAVVQGEAAFAAREGTVTSSEALADPLGPSTFLTYPEFARPELAATLVDSHFQARDREGRLLAFLGRFLHERGGAAVVGIGLDEEVALTVEDGRYRVEATTSGEAGAGSVWLYRVAGPVALAPGKPLMLDSVRRVRLEHGAEGPWPYGWGGAGTGEAGQALHVDAGVVRTGTP